MVWRSFDGHGQHLGYIVVHTLHLNAAVRGIGAGGILAHPEKLVGGMRKLRPELEPTDRAYGARTRRTHENRTQPRADATVLADVPRQTRRSEACWSGVVRPSRAGEDEAVAAAAARGC